VNASSSPVHIWWDCRAATFAQGGAFGSDAPYGLIEDAALVSAGEQLLWVGPRAALPGDLIQADATLHSLGGALVTPGLIDCHTHLIHGGDRAREFEMRLEGATYEQIARAGGGIANTVRATRAASEPTLLEQAGKRLRDLLAEGVTTVEIKSGYGLDLDSERKCLRVARELARRWPVDVRTTFLGAHAVPPEYQGRADDYTDAVVHMLPLLHAEGLVDAVDAFCENIGFSVEQTRSVFEAARALGLPCKLHAEQLSDSGGAVLAASYAALSCDHLEWLGEDGVQAMARAGTVAVLLPGAFYFLRETRPPPIAALRAAGVPMAISTDCNPGSSPCTSPLLMANMACTLFRLAPQETLAGLTTHAARALGLADRGRLEAGLRADFAVWDVGHPAELCYRIAARPHLQTVRAGLACQPHP